MGLQTLNNFDFKFLILWLVPRYVSEDDFADLLPLVGAFTDERAVASEQMLGEEFEEVILRTVFVLVNVANQDLSEQ